MFTFKAEIKRGFHSEEHVWVTGLTEKEDGVKKMR